MKKTILLTESDIKGLVMEALNELKWDTYQRTSNEREKQRNHRSSQDLRQMAKQRFDDEYVQDFQYDTMGDKMKGKQSPKFQSNFSTSTPSIEATNSRGDKLTHHKVNGKHKYYDRKGVTTPQKFFGNKNVAAAYEKAIAALDGFVAESVRRNLMEMTNTK